MSWLHQLTGFQLFVIASLYDTSFSLAETRYEQTKKGATLVAMTVSGVCAAFFSIYWLVVAAWPVIAH